MTALCGLVVQAGPDNLEVDCAAMLEGQRIYGLRSQIRQAEKAAFGINLFETLPEDAFDRQPLLIDGHLLVADIRLDNRDDLVRALGLTAELRESADSEVLLRAWLRWGESCLNRIVGDFAFAIYEIEGRKLTLARDCLGQRPLFFAEAAGSIAFSSMPSGLLALRRFQQGFNHRALALAAADILASDDSTYFRSVHRVLPGQIVTFSAQGRRSRVYWQPSFDELKLKSAADYVDAYRHVLDEAVGPILRRVSGPIACHLSSGLDSSAVATTAARLKRPDERMIAFTAAPRAGFHEPRLRGRFADESDAAARTARMHGMKHEIVRTAGSGLSHIRKLVATSQEPNCNILNQDWFWSIEQRARDDGARILLTGEHGNLTLNAGGLPVLADWVGRSDWSTWWREARWASRRADVRWRGILLNSFEPWLPQSARRALYRRFRDLETRAQSVFLQDSCIREIGDSIESGFLPERSGNSSHDRLRALRLTDNGALHKGSLARYGVDSRAPLGDRRVIEFSLRLPLDQTFSHGVSQPLARRALSDRVPREVLEAQTRGYQSADWFENIDPEEVRSMTDEIAASAQASALIDVGKIRQTFANWTAGDIDKLGGYQQLAIDLPKALATGLFIVEAERWMSARAQAPARSAPAGARGPSGEPR